MPTVVKRRIGSILPADPTQPLLLLRVLPVRHALAEFLIVLPAAHVRVARGGLDESAGAVLLVVDPVAVVRVAVLEGVQAVAVALAELEGSLVGGAAVVEHLAVPVAVAVFDLALVVLGGEVVVCEVTVEVGWEVAGECAVGEEGLQVRKRSTCCDCAALFTCQRHCDDDDRGVVQINLEERSPVLDRSERIELFFFPNFDFLLVFHRQTKALHKRLIDPR